MTNADPRSGLADGQWHRLHPATPLLKGGIWLIAVLGFLLTSFRDRIIDAVIPTEPGAPPDSADLLTQLYLHGHLGIAALVVLAVLLVGVVAFWLSWRMHSFRIASDAVQVRSGILFRVRRDARLDRIQGVAIQRPLLARLFGAAKLELSVAGQDSKVQLSYLRSRDVDALRAEILVLASGGEPDASGTPDASGAALPDPGLVARRVSELLASDVPAGTPPESVVRIPPVRLAGSLLAGGFTLLVVAIAAVIALSIVMFGHLVFLFLIVPGVIAAGGYYVTRFTRSLRYSIVGTPDGIRVGYGLLSTSNETLPPGRIHAIGISQPLLWRPFGWWSVRVNRAGHPSSGSAEQASTLLLPVGRIADVRTVLSLVLATTSEDAGSEIVDAAESGLARGEGFTSAPGRAWPLHPLVWRRTGMRFELDALLLRSGVFHRRVGIIPLARVQSVELRRGPAHRALRLSALRVHTVAGPVPTSLPVIGRDEGATVWEETAARATRYARSDRTHRWARPGAAFGPGTFGPETLGPETMRGTA